MREFAKRLLSYTPLYHPLRNLAVKGRERRALEAWESAGRPDPPPPLVKQDCLKTYARTYNLKILVETGTFYGDMVQAMKPYFDQIYSIELSAELYQWSKERFKWARQIEIFHGDSGRELGTLIVKLRGPALFWLDGHYSGANTARGDKDPPVYDELGHILGGKEKRHVILIDDADCFGRNPGYPTIEELREYVFSQRNDLDIVVQGNIIRLTPKCLPSFD